MTEETDPLKKKNTKEGGLLPTPDSPNLFQAAAWEPNPLHPNGGCERGTCGGAEGMGEEELSICLQRLRVKKLNRKKKR